ncbi:hypothetical protein CDL12_02725 [Handroanthus impetiginosus]|uniref:Aluminum-activated malate transporter n=1 Tax=Handroanthus impetiginosus TaxID=429701 RepID=A0A2G9I4J3_9LAMI|nr:hypothetical protein CDL12_02725 [Handroanthus impetiginosus]
MRAVLTVVAVFEYTVATGTFLAGTLGIGVHWIASQSGEEFEPVILQGSVFLLAAAATFSRFIPPIKARFHFGVVIFVLTFGLVSISGYRVDKFFELAHHRLSTIIIGTSICILTSMLIWPVWAGTELHDLIKNNMEKLSDSLDGCVADYFRDDVEAYANKNEDSNKIFLGCECVLNSKATEEALVPDFLKKHFSKFCIRLSATTSAVMKELAVSIRTMTKSLKIDHMVRELRNAVEELQNFLKSLSEQTISSTEPKIPHSDMGEGNESPTVVTLVEVLPLVTVSSLLIEIAARTEKNGLADKAKFRVESTEKTKKSQN